MQTENGQSRLSHRTSPSPDVESFLSDIFKEISNPEFQNDQRFVDIQHLNKNLRSPSNYSMLDFEEFHLFSLTVNNLYDTDGEISENEFLLFCQPWRKVGAHVNKRITQNLFALNPQEDYRMFQDLLKECDLEYNRKFVNFLDGGVAVDKGYNTMNTPHAHDGDITKIIRKGEYGVGISSQDNNFQGFGVNARTSADQLNSIQAVPQSTLNANSTLDPNQPVPQPMYESKAHQFGGKLFSL